MAPKNKNTSKFTVECQRRHELYRLWDNETEWLWARGVRSGCFVIIVVSTRGCWMLYSTKIADNPNISEDEKAELKSSIMKETQDNKSDDFSVYGARAYVIGPTFKDGSANKADQVAHDFCKNLATSIQLETLNPESKAKFKTYDGAKQSSSSSSSSDPDVNTIEVNVDPEGNGKPAIYINGKKQDYSAVTAMENLMKKGNW